MGRIKAKTDIPPAPGGLRIIQAFVNTVDRDARRDQLTNPQALAAWLTVEGLLAPGTELTAEDHQRAIAAREGVRYLIAAGPDSDPERLAAIERTFAGALLGPRFNAEGIVRFEPVNPGLDGAFGRLVASLAEAQREGLWPRFKICASGSCRSAFYDTSTNRTGLWCRPRCGSRIRTRDHRRRKRRRS